VTRPRFSELFAHSFGDVNRFFDEALRGEANGAWFAPAALWEEADQYRVEIELPGVKQADLEVTFEKGVLTVRAERKAPEGERKGWHNERRYGRVERQVKLGEKVDADSIAATLADGVLSITVHKQPEVQPRKIEVKAGEE
jgi:HSP20 family protein